MVHKRQKDDQVRRLARVGKRSVSITIPVEDLSSLGWRQRQKVAVNRRGGRLAAGDKKTKNKNNHGY